MTQWTPIQGLKEYGTVLARKVSLVTLGWVLVYFASYPFRVDGSPLMLFSPMLGALGGLVIGWYLATNAVEDASMSGLVLWIILVLAAWIPMCLVELVMHMLLPKFNFGFGGWMVLMSAMLLAMAASVWHASTQE